MNKVYPRTKTSLQLDIHKHANVVSRTVPITQNWEITVYEWEKPAAVIETYWQVQQQGLALTSSTSKDTASSNSGNSHILDPFGLVTWPGSVVAAQELLEHRNLIQGSKVLILGGGVGIEAQAAAQLGAAKVIATDIHPTTLKLLQYGADQDPDTTAKIRTQLLDIGSVEPLPECDVMVISDMLYNDELAQKVIRRIVEARKSHDPPPAVLVSDSQRFVRGFDLDLSAKLQSSIHDTKMVKWQSRFLPNFTGSGVAIDEDQTYAVKARLLWIGLEEKLANRDIDSFEKRQGVVPPTHEDFIAPFQGEDDDDDDDVSPYQADFVTNT